MPMKFVLKIIMAAVCAVVFSFHAFAQTEEEGEAAVGKMNAYVSFLNRAIRASDSLKRYESWVNMKKGPTGKERVIYGLYAPYDVREEIEAAKSAAAEEPKMAELDASILRFISVYETLAPVLEKASKYYDRSDYKGDKMKAGKEFHAEIAKAAPEFVAARRDADTLVSKEKRKLDLLQLQALEKAEGKKSRWHVRNVMLHAQAIMDILPTGDKPIVDMVVFNEDLESYAKAVREFDDYATEHPNSFHVFESSPASLLSKLRDFQKTLQKYKGDARRGADDLQWIIQDYNMMVSTSETATTFAKD